jgi:hypothetical protein
MFRPLTSLTLVLLAPLAFAAAPAGGKGEKALRTSFYLNAVPTMVELVGDLKKDVVEALGLTPKAKAAVDKALADHWNEKKLYALSGAALEKQLTGEALDAAIVQMTPEVQAMIKAGIQDADPTKAQAWLEQAKKAPDALARQKLAARICVHMPQPDAFKEMLSQIAEVLADAAQVTQGNDDARATLKSSLLEGMGPALAAMGDQNIMATSAFIAYRDQPTEKMKLLADALDSEAGKKLHGAAPSALVTGAKQARADLVAQLKKDLPPAKKK